MEGELERTADALGGAAQLEVSNGPIGIPEELVATVLAVPGVLTASPLIQATMRLDDAQHRGQPLRVIGVDFTADQKVRTYAVTRNDLEIRDPLRLLSSTSSIVISHRLSERLGIGQGGSVPVRLGDHHVDLTVEGMLSRGGLAEAFDGQVAVMDVFALQELQGRRGWVDRIDIVPDHGVDVQRLEVSLRQAVKGKAYVQAAGRRAPFVEQAISTLRLGIWIIVSVALLVAAFLAYATMSISVDRRTEEFALLQSAGLEASRVRLLLYVDASVLSMLGTALGLPLGTLLSGWFLTFFSTASEQFRVSSATRLPISLRTVGLASLVGIAVSLIASIEPAARATAHPPLEVLAKMRRPGSGASRELPPPMLVAVLVVISLLCTGSWLHLPALLRLATTFTAVIALVIVVFGFYLPGAIFRVTPLLERIPKIGAFVGTALAARPLHAGLTIASLVAIVAALAETSIALNSINVGIHDWLASRYPGATVATATDPFAEMSPDPLPFSAIEAIREAPGVDAVVEVFNTPFLYRGEEVLLFARSAAVIAKRGRMATTSGDPRVIADRVARGGVTVSERFSRRFGVATGDLLTLDTPKGSRSFEVVGLTRALTLPSDTIDMDIHTFDSLWKRSGATGVIFWPAHGDTGVVDRIREQLGADYPLFFVSADEYAQYSARTVDRFISLLYVLAAFTGLLGGVAILNLLIGAVTERRRELALLRAAGGTSRTISGIVLFDGLAIAGVGTAVGLALAVACAFPLMAVVDETLGWNVAPIFRYGDLALLAAIVVVASAVTSIYPAWFASRAGALEMFAAE